MFQLLLLYYYLKLFARENKGILPANGEGLNIDEYQKTLFEWCYPELSAVYKKSAKEYPKLNDQGELDPITDN
jgi:tRNA (guanosine-2'-O-)-methyltransferase